MPKVVFRIVHDGGSITEGFYDKYLPARRFGVIDDLAIDGVLLLAFVDCVSTL